MTEKDLVHKVEGDSNKTRVVKGNGGGGSLCTRRNEEKQAITESKQIKTNNKRHTTTSRTPMPLKQTENKNSVRYKEATRWKQSTTTMGR